MDGRRWPSGGRSGGARRGGHPELRPRAGPRIDPGTAGAAQDDGLEVSDRISVVIDVPAEKRDWAQTHAELISGEVLATSFEFGRRGGRFDIGDGVRGDDREGLMTFFFF